MSNRGKLEESMKTLEEGIKKVKFILDGYPACKLFTSEEYMRYYEYPSILLCLLCLLPHSLLLVVLHYILRGDTFFFE